MYLNQRQVRSCPAGTQWYVCVTNDFTGCCSVDACNLPTCPDAVSSSPPASSSTSPSTSTLTPTTQNAGVLAARTSASPSVVTTVVVDTPSPTPKGPIIAGVICGIVVLAIFTAMLWFFCRRRKQLNDIARGRSTPLVGSDGSNRHEKLSQDQETDEESQMYSRGSGGVFGPFGGYHRTPSVEAREANDRARAHSLDIATVSVGADADEPIPDPEKSSLVAPPAHEHPANHPVPGMAPEVPVYSHSQSSTHPASRSASSREPARNSLPSQQRKPSNSHAKRGPSYDSIPSQATTSDTHSKLTRAPFSVELHSPTFSPKDRAIPDESPELPALTFSPISLDTLTHNTPSRAFTFPSPSDNAPIPRFPSRSGIAPSRRRSSPMDITPSQTYRNPSPSQIGKSIETFRPTPLTDEEIAEIGSSVSQHRPTPLSAGEIAELESSLSIYRPTPPSATASPPLPSSAPYETTEYPINVLSISSGEHPSLTPFRTPSLERASRALLYRRPSLGQRSNTAPPVPIEPLDSPTPPPLRLKKRSTGHSDLPHVRTTPKKSPTPSKDLPFNYITLPSPQSPQTPSAIHTASKIKTSKSAMDKIVHAVATYNVQTPTPSPTHLHKRKDTAIPTESTHSKKALASDQPVKLTHNHSREWSESDREHVMSWATYTVNSPVELEGDEFTPMVARAEKVEKFHHASLRQMAPSPEPKKQNLEGQKLNRKSPQQDLRKEKEDRKAPTKLDLDRTNRDSLREKKTPRGSPSSEEGRKKDSPRNQDVSPLFSPMPAGHKFSPLSPEERVWAGHE